MNIAKMMQQAKMMQEKMAALQDEMGNTLVEGSSGGGVVKVSMTCKGECRAITIDSSLLKADEKEILEDLIKTAINDAKGKADAKMSGETQKMMSGLGLPADLAGKLPF